MNLYKNEHSHPLADAQRNLMGRTHYVDPGTLRFHKSRILCARVHAEGLLYSIIESCAADMHNRKRVFRYVIFNVHGTVIDRPGLEESYSSRVAADKAMWKALGTIDAIKATREALQTKHKHDVADFKSDMALLKVMAAKAK